MHTKYDIKWYKKIYDVQINYKGCDLQLYEGVAFSPGIIMSKLKINYA